MPTPAFRTHTGVGTSLYGVTRKATLLLSVPLGVVTETKPVFAPVGTVVLISVDDTTLNVADVPLNDTLVDPVRLFPRMITEVPTLPDVGLSTTKGFRLLAKLKTVPIPPPGPEPPMVVVP